MKKTIAGILAALCVILAIIFGATSCTDNQRAKSFGGTTTIHLPAGEKLVTVTWKGEADIWYLTKPMGPNDSAQTYIFHQDKGGMLNLTGNGEVILIESK
jgi:hypothetical protein